jgi:site-specific DNA-methyltransferase (adenine-specific)
MTYELMVGDCLDKMKDLPDKSIDMVLCDLPYGTTACSWDSVLPFDLLWTEYWRIIKKGGAVVLTSVQPFTTLLISSQVARFRYCWYWNKSKPTGFPNANYMPLRDIEDVCVFSEGKPNPAAILKTPYNPQGIVEINEIKNRKTRRDTVNNGERDGSLSGEYVRKFENYPRQLLWFHSEGKTVHPTQKPVGLMGYLIRTYTNEGETVLDNTMGSGTTGVACANTGRKFIGIEKDEGYFKIAEQRIKEAFERNR